MGNCCFYDSSPQILSSLDHDFHEEYEYFDEYFYHNVNDTYEPREILEKRNT